MLSNLSSLHHQTRDCHLLGNTSSRLKERMGLHDHRLGSDKLFPIRVFLWEKKAEGVEVGGALQPGVSKGI